MKNKLQILVMVAALLICGRASAQTVGGSNSSGAGANSGVQPKTFTSSAVVQAGVLGFTAAGSLLCSDILLETNATGLAAGTSFTITSNSLFGPLVVCSNLVSGLGVRAAVKCSTGTVTEQPFTLIDTNTLTLKCTVADCTGAGTIKITPNCINLTSGATLN